MGYGRRKKKPERKYGGNKKPERKYDNERKRKHNRSLKMKIGGIILSIVGILLLHYIGIPGLLTNGIHNVSMIESIVLVAGFFLIIGGLLMLFLSLNKGNQIKLADGLDKSGKGIVGILGDIFKERCLCCDCQNCGKNHNHWTHRDDDDRHHRGW